MPKISFEDTGNVRLKPWGSATVPENSTLSGAADEKNKFTTHAGEIDFCVRRRRQRALNRPRPGPPRTDGFTRHADHVVVRVHELRRRHVQALLVRWSVEP